MVAALPILKRPRMSPMGIEGEHFLCQIPASLPPHRKATLFRSIVHSDDVVWERSRGETV
jgi:hypothetical protein